MTIAEMNKRLGEIVAKLGEFQNLADYTSEDLATIKAFNTEAEGLKTNIEAKTALEGVVTMAAQPAPRATQAVAPIAPKAVVNDGFENGGSFFRAVAHSGATGRVDKRLVNTASVERVGEDGGFLIPTDFRTEIQSVVEGDDSLLSKTRQFKTSSNQLVLPVSETAPWDGSGIQAFWEGEAEGGTESKPVFRQANLRLHKITTLVRVSEELLEDAPALESYIKTEAPAAFVHKINNAIIDGDGVGKPLGFLRSGFKVTVAKEAGQNADTVNTANIENMYARILPKSIKNAAWLVHPEVLPSLRLMKFVEGANSPVPAYMPPAGLSAAPYGTLMGLPIMPMMGGVKELGTEGDICLVDLNHYITAVKTSGIKSEISTHVYFVTGESAFRFVMRVAGECPYSKPVKTENGNYEMSGLVTLADR
ncbi:MAG: phage major capsid protein [Bacteriovoracaceae bacterium]|nr:phage major capsid protein [Bacteriovoracaceae bacterium]